MEKKSLTTHLVHAAKLECPVCGTSGMFKGVLGMKENCEECGLKFEKEPGYWLPTMYLGYALSVATTVPGWVLMALVLDMSLAAQLYVLSGLALLSPIATFWHCRALWLNVDAFITGKKVEKGDDF